MPPHHSGESISRSLYTPCPPKEKWLYLPQDGHLLSRVKEAINLGIDFSGVKPLPSYSPLPSLWIKGLSPTRPVILRDIQYMRNLYWSVKCMKQDALKFYVQLRCLLPLLSFHFLINKIKGLNLMISSSSLKISKLKSTLYISLPLHFIY